MIKETILIIEDDPQLPMAWKAAIESAGDSLTEVLIARSYEEGLDLALKGNIAYAIVDLGLPAKLGGDVVEIGPDHVCTLGFDLLRSLQENNADIAITIASRFTDDERVADLKNKLILDDNAPIIRVLNKNLDADYLDKILQDTHGLDFIQPHLARAGVRAIHPLERRLARSLWQKAAIAVEQWPAPILIFFGQSRAGKGAWARAFAEFVDSQRPSSSRPDFLPLNLGELTRRGVSDSALIELFGARNYQGIADCAGYFELNTCYKLHSQEGVPRQGLAQTQDVPDYSKSGIACLDELGNLPHDLQPMLLAVLDSNPINGGRVKPAGGGGAPISIGCSIIFLTNSTLHSRVVKSEDAEQGELREDLYLRLKAEPGGWLHVPSLSELGFETAIEHLEAALDTGSEINTEISVSARRLFEDACGKNLVTMDTINTVTKSFHRSGGMRLTDEHILSAISDLIKKRELRVTKKRMWTIHDFERKSIVRQGEKQYYILKTLIEHIGVDLTKKRIQDYLDRGPELKEVREKYNWNPYKNTGALNQAMSTLRSKVNDKQLVLRSGIKLQDRGQCAIPIS